MSWNFQPTANAFCPTGEGGGKDNSCSAYGPKKGGGSKGSSLKELVDSKNPYATLYSPLHKIISNLEKEGKSLDDLSDSDLLEIAETAISNGMKEENRITSRGAGTGDEQKLKVIRMEKRQLWNWANSTLKVVPFSGGEPTPERKPLKPVKPKASEGKSKGRGIFKESDTPSSWYERKW